MLSQLPFVGEEQLFWLLRKVLYLGLCVLYNTSIIAQIWNDEVYL